MKEYLLPIKAAFVSFPIIAGIFTIPFLIYQYRKYGYSNKFRALVLYSFLLYILTTYYLIILPLPSTRNTCSLYTPGTKFYQLMPFQFIKDILKETHVNLLRPNTYMHLLKERAFLQVSFNTILLTPLGIYLRYYFRKDLKKTIVICFGVSLFFEITQITGLYGIYNCPYRLFDVDDLLLNTLGGFIGFKIAPIFTYFLPKTQELDKDIDLSKMSVGIIRRCLALCVDWMIIRTLSNLLGINQNLLVDIAVECFYFIVLVYATNGRTIGKWIFRIHVEGKNEYLTFKEVFKRYGLLYYGVLGINRLLNLGMNMNENTMDGIILAVIMISIDAILGIHIIWTLCTKQRIFFYEKISGTQNRITVKENSK